MHKNYKIEFVSTITELRDDLVPASNFRVLYYVHENKKFYRFSDDGNTLSLDNVLPTKLGGSTRFVNIIELGGVIPITHSNLLSLKTSNGLVTGQSYLVTDHKTQHIIPNTTDKHVANVEMLLLKATSSNTFDISVNSIDFPNDTLHYDIEDNAFEDNMWSNKHRKYINGSNFTDQIQALNGYLRSITFTNSLNGYAVGFDNDQSMSLVYQTTDGGITWSNNSFFNSYWQDLYSVFFSDSLHGHIVGDSGIYYQTADGGTTWTDAHGGFSNAVFSSVYFVDNLNGYICGNQEIWKTSDGGINWIQITEPSGGTYISSIWFLTINVGFICNIEGHIYKTIDGGQNWTNPFNEQAGSLNNFYFVNSAIGYCCGASNQILRTIDGGDTWAHMDYSGNFESIRFTDINTGYATSNTQIIKTIDGGLTWNPYTNLVPIGHSLNFLDITFTNGIGYICGQNDDTGDVLILKMEDKPTRTGKITYRKDTVRNLETHYDWRNVKFRRWLDATTSKYVVIFDNNNTFDDFYTFHISTEPTNSSGIITNNAYDTVGQGYCNIIIDAINRMLPTISYNNIVFSMTPNGNSEYYYYSNIFGVDCVNSTFIGTLYNNTIGTGFHDNLSYEEFKYNIIGSNFAYNIIGSNFAYNVIKNNFAGTDSQYKNVIGSAFQYNTIEDMLFAVVNSKLIIGNNFQKNTIKAMSIPDGTDFSTATHVYGNYDCEIFKRKDGTPVLKYFDDDYSYKFTSITD